MDDVGSGAGTPATAPPRRPLTARERRWTALWAAAPVVVTAVVLVPFAIVGPAGPGDVVGAALVYGGLLGLAAGFVYVDRAHARQCPRCRQRNPRRSDACGACGYDLARRPRYACEERHELYLEEGLCACGRRLHELPTARGVGPEVAMILRMGAWLLVFLVAVGLVLQYLSR